MILLVRRAVALAVVAAVLLPTSGAAARPPLLGIADDLAFADFRSGPRKAAFRAARDTGASVVRLTLDWSAVAPEGRTKPVGLDAADPASPLYNWGYIEDAVRDAARYRLRVLLTVVRAPRWAGRRSPDPGELAAVLRAAARRFSGFYPDPKRLGDGLTRPGAALPAVHLWQVWDEPNRTSSLRPSGPAHYRALLNAGGDALREVSDDNVVAAGGTGARGAAGFWRGLRGVRFDVAVHHPVSGRGPIATRPLERLARQLHGKPIWLTDVAWATPPLAPHGVGLERQALNLRISLRRAASVPAVRLVAWEGLRDRRTYVPRRFPTIASGLYKRSGRPKPVLRVFSPGLPSSATWLRELQR
jgi:hypothetical protein